MKSLGIRLKERFSRSAFFFGALLFHLVLFLMLVGYVVWHAPTPETPAGFGHVAISPPPPVQPPPPHADATDGEYAPSIVPEAIHIDGNVPGVQVKINPKDFVDLNSSSHGGPSIRLPVLPETGNGHEPRVNLPKIKAIMEARSVPGKPGFMRFPIYIAKYADGDWDCNIYMHDGKPVSGSLPNLMAKIHDWSHGELDGREIKVVALDSPEVLDNPPPFIFFTGHRDFHLTKAEIENLRKYLMIGGVIWGDNAFAGNGSRFDVAFHREMKCVLPDADLQFQDMTMDHDIFTSKTHFTINDIPAGMNRRADPIQCINMDGKLAVLYTPNDYSDMMTMLLLPGLSEREAQMDGWNHWEPQHPLFTNAAYVWHSSTFFRNYQPASSMQAFKLSMNILLDLLHQYDDETILTP